MTELVSMGPDDLERITDRLGLSAGMIDPDPVLKAVAAAVDGEDPEIGGDESWQLRLAVVALLKLRIADEQGFDLACLKILRPEMTQADLLETMVLLKKANWSHRGRCSDKIVRFVQRFPEFEGVFLFDRRGGARSHKVTGMQLSAEYEELKAEEKQKPTAERRYCFGEGGLLHALAIRHRIMGLFGKPSWNAVRQRIKMAKRLDRKHLKQPTFDF